MSGELQPQHFRREGVCEKRGSAPAAENSTARARTGRVSFHVELTYGLKVSELEDGASCSENGSSALYLLLPWRLQNVLAKGLAARAGCGHNPPVCPILQPWFT